MQTKPIAYCNPMWADIIRRRLPEFEWVTDARVPVAYGYDAAGLLRWIFKMPSVKPGLRKCDASQAT